jgi:hypothetical protein
VAQITKIYKNATVDLRFSKPLLLLEDYYGQMNKSLSVEIEKAYTTKREGLNFTVLNVTSTVVKLWINFTDP